MMTERQITERFLEFQEHPEQISDEQLQQALHDNKMRELVEQMAFAKRAFKNNELQKQECDVEEEWNKFAAKHFEEIDFSKQNNSIGSQQKSIFNHQKVASFIGLLIVSGIAFAAIHIVFHHAGRELNSPPQEMQIANPHQQATTEKAVKTDTTIKKTQDDIQQPIVFDNVRLDEILLRIASYYHAEVVFQNEATRELRFYFVWKPEDGIEHAVEKLNRFESLTIRLEEGDGENQSTKIIVE